MPDPAPDLVTIRDLKKLATPQPAVRRFLAQVEAALQKTSKAGKPYFEIRFTDGLDSHIVRAFDDTPQFAKAQALRGGEFVEVSGEWFDSGQFGIDARWWDTRALSVGEVDALLAGNGEFRERQDDYEREIHGLIGAIADPRLRGVCERFMAAYGERMRRTGAARDYHHARRGGLIEHVGQMMLTATAICAAYPNLNRDLLLAGALFHDCGKLWENAFAREGFEMPHTDVGELLGHIPTGMEIANKLWREMMDEDGEKFEALEPPSDQVRLHLLHLIAAHHGEYQFGSPTVPKTPEAMVLHHVDNIDAKMEMFLRGYERSAQLSRNVYQRARPLPGNLVRPLPHFDASAAKPANETPDPAEEGAKSAPLPAPDTAEPASAESDGAVENAGTPEDPPF